MTLASLVLVVIAAVIPADEALPGGGRRGSDNANMSGKQAGKGRDKGGPS